MRRGGVAGVEKEEVGAYMLMRSRRLRAGLRDAAAAVSAAAAVVAADNDDDNDADGSPTAASPDKSPLPSA